MIKSLYEVGLVIFKSSSTSPSLELHPQSTQMFPHKVPCKRHTSVITRGEEKHPQMSHSLEQILTPPCPNGCKAVISDAVSIGLFPLVFSTSTFFSSFSLPPPPFPTIRKYSSILSHSPPHSSPPQTHTQCTQVPQLSHRVGTGTFQVPSIPP